MSIHAYRYEIANIQVLNGSCSFGLSIARISETVPNICIPLTKKTNCQNHMFSTICICPMETATTGGHQNVAIASNNYQPRQYHVATWLQILLVSIGRMM
jgi:hypothetical protein